MPQMRRALSARPEISLRAFLLPLGEAWNRVTLADPGLLRLLLASRGTLSVFLTTLACLAIGSKIGAPVVDFAPGILFACLAPVLVQDPTWRQRLASMLWLSLPAVVVAAATSFPRGQGLAGELMFLVLLFACFLLQARNRRVMGLGFMAVIIAYIGLYLRLPPATIPTQILSVAIGVPVTAFACLVVFPLRPAAALRRMIKTVQLCAAQVLRDAGPDARSSERLPRSLARLNTVALAADDQLALLGPAAREAARIELLNLELATARLIASLPSPGADLRAHHARQLRLHAKRLRRGGWIETEDRKPRQAGPFAQVLNEIRRAARALEQAAIGPAPAQAAPAQAPAPTPGPLAWRLAARVTLASALAMAGGIALSENRWFWSVITTYVVFLGARSRGDTIYKGLQRVGGTILGIVGGLVLAYVVTGRQAAEIVLVLASMFGMYYCTAASYTVGIFCVTILLGLIYSMLGSPLEELLVLRLEETAIGAAAAIFVAAFVLPTRTRDAVRLAGAGVVKALAAALRARAGGGDTLAATRAVDRQVADLRLALMPLTAGRSLWPRGHLDRPASALLECVQWARALAVSGEAADPPDPRTSARLLGLADRLDALADPAASDAAPPAPAPADPGAPSSPLDNLERAVDRLGERIAIGALEGFALDR
jgi:uncharacterized membrane protein YccC